MADLSRVSCCTIPLIRRPVGEAMQIIADAGFTRIDLLGRMPHLSLDPAECDPADVERQAQAHGLQIANLGTYVGRAFGSDDSEEREAEVGQVKRAIDLAVRFGARSIRVFAGNDDPETIGRLVPLYKRCAEYAAQQQVYMGIENHGGGINGSPERCAELASKVGSPFFGVLYEPYNLASHGVDYVAGFKVMREHIVHTHFKDGHEKDGKYELTMFGQGTIDYLWVMEQLDAQGYEGTFALEYELKWESPDTGLAKWYSAYAAL